MKFVFIEKHRAVFSIKAMCRVLRVARNGWYVWRCRRHQVNLRQQFRLVCDDAVSKAFHHANSGTVPRGCLMSYTDYKVKTIAASLRHLGLRAKAAGSSVRSAIGSTGYLCLKIC